MARVTPTSDAKPVHILVIEDQREIRSALRRSLEEAGYTVSEAGTKSEAMARLECDPPVSLITLDLRLGSEDGLLLAREIRVKRNVPIIMVTALNDPLDRLSGLEHGADDYIVKPFHIREVLLRIQSVLRRYELERKTTGGDAEQHDEIYRCEAGIVDVNRRRLTSLGGPPVSLTDAEFDILVAFIRNPARILTRDDLTLRLKGRLWSPTDRTLDGHIARLRKKIEKDLQEPRLIKTVWGVGYAFAGTVERLDDAAPLP